MEKLPIIDMHTHLHINLGNPGLFTQAMEECGVEKAVLLSMPFPIIGSNSPLIFFAKMLHPDHFAAFTAIDYRDLMDPDFPGNALRRLENDVYHGGAQGIKMYIQNASVMLHPTDERLEPVFIKAGELGLPILMHLMIDADRVASPFHQQAGFTSERLSEDLEVVLEKHENTNIIIAHLGCCLTERGLERLGRLLDKYANLYADTSATFLFFQMLRFPELFRSFIDRFAHRIVFGTDTDLSADIDPVTLLRYYSEAFRINRDFYSTRGVFRLTDELRRRRREWVHKTDSWEKVEVFPDSPVGLGLDLDSLKRIFHTNASRLLGKEHELDNEWIIERLVEYAKLLDYAGGRSLHAYKTYAEHFIDLFKNSRQDFERSLNAGGQERLRDTVSEQWTFSHDHTQYAFQILNSHSRVIHEAPQDKEQL